MASLLTSVLKKQIGLFVNDFKPERLQNWKIDDVELNAEMIQQVLSIPNEIKLESMTCNSIQVNIPWRKLKHSPIVFELDRVVAVLEEPAVISDSKQTKKKRSSKFLDRILDGFTFVVNEIDIRIQPLPRAGSESSILHITSGPISVQMTDNEYNVVDLQKARKFSSISKNEYLRFRFVDIEWASLDLESLKDEGVNPVPLFSKHPFFIKVKSKYIRSSSLPGGRAMTGTEVQLGSDKTIDVWFDEHRWKTFENFIHSMLTCFSRHEGDSGKPIIEHQGITAATPAPTGQTRWKRMKNFIQKRKNRMQEADEEKVAADIEEDQSEATEDTEDTQMDGLDNEELDEMFGTEVVEQSDGLADDIMRNSISIEIQSGTLSFFETMLDSKRQFLKVEVSDLFGRFEPHITRKRQELVAFGLFPIPDVTDSQTVSKLFLSIRNVIATDPSPHPSKHVGYRTLLRSQASSDSPSPAFLLQMTSQRAMRPGSGKRSSKSVDVQLAPCRLVWDGDTIWRARRVLSPPQQLQHFIGLQMEKVVDAVLQDSVVFKIVLNEPTIILPPFAGYHGKASTEIAAMVLHARAKKIFLSSWGLRGKPEHGSMTDGCQLATLSGSQFPNSKGDFRMTGLNTAESDTITMESHKYYMSILEGRADILDQHAAPPHRLLDMSEFNVALAMNAASDSPDTESAQFELSISLSEVEMHFARRHSLYLRYAVDWRVQILTCDSLGVETSFGQHGAVSHAGSHDAGLSIGPAKNVKQLAPYISRAEEYEHSLPITFVVFMKANKARVNMLDRNDGMYVPGATDETIQKKNTALIVSEWKAMEAVVCNHLDKVVMKARVNTMEVYSPEYERSHFGFLLAPVQGDSGQEKASIRYEKLRQKRFGPQYANLQQPHENDNAEEIHNDRGWARLCQVKISVIIQLLVKIIAFIRAPEYSASVIDSPGVESGSPSKNLLSPAASLVAAMRDMSQNPSPKKGKIRETIARNLKDLDWDLTLNDCELLMVDSSDTPECLPLHAHKMVVSRRGKVGDELQQSFKVDSNSSKLFASVFTGQTLSTHQLCEPFDFAASVCRTKAINKHSDNNNKDEGNWRAAIGFSSDRMKFVISREQLILLLNIAENQISNIAEAGKILDESRSIKTKPKIVGAGVGDLAYRSRSGVVGKSKTPDARSRSLIKTDSRVPSSEPRPSRKSVKGSKAIAEPDLKVKMKLGSLDLYLTSDNESKNLPFAHVNIENLTYKRVSKIASELPPRTALGFLHTGVENSMASSAGGIDYGTNRVVVLRMRTFRIWNTMAPSNSSAFARTIVRPREKKEMEAGVMLFSHEDAVADENEAPSDIMSIRIESFKPNSAHVSDQTAVSYWVFELNPLVLVYEPVVVQKFRHFFKLLGEQKEIRNRYLKMKRDLRDALSEGHFSSDDGVADVYLSVFASRLARTQAEKSVEEKVHRRQRVFFKVVATEPMILVPENMDMSTSIDTASTLLELKMKMLLVSNDSVEATDKERDVSPSTHEGIVAESGVARTDYYGSNLTLTLLSVDPDRHAVLQTVPIIQPVNFQVLVHVKGGKNGSIMRVESTVDSVRAALSLQKYVTLLNITQTFLKTFSNVFEERSQTSLLEVPVGKGSTPSDLVLDFNITHFDLTIVSDYVAELELFFLYFKQIEATLGLYHRHLEVSASLRLEALVNNLNFMLPDTVIEPCFWTLELRKGAQEFELKPVHRSHKSDTVMVNVEEHDAGIIGGSLLGTSLPSDPAAGSQTDMLDISVTALSPVKIRVDRELLREVYEIYSLLDDSVDEPSGHLSHFQYIFENSTESTMWFTQENTGESSMLRAGESAPYSFSNPYLPKLLNITVGGGWARTAPFSLDIGGSQVMKTAWEGVDIDTDSELPSSSHLQIKTTGKRLWPWTRNTAKPKSGRQVVKHTRSRSIAVSTYQSQPSEGISSRESSPRRRSIEKESVDEHEPVKPDELSLFHRHVLPQDFGLIDAVRSVVVDVRPRRLKKIVSFFPSHRIVNNTDTAISFECSGPFPQAHEAIASGQSYAVCYNEKWSQHVEFRFRTTNQTWGWSAPFKLSHGRRGWRDSPTVVRMFPVDPDLNPLELSMNQRMILVSYERDPVLPIWNITLRPPVTVVNLSAFPILYHFPRLNLGGSVAPHAEFPFFFDYDVYDECILRLNDNAWSEAVALQRNTMVVRKLDPAEDGDNSVSLNVVTQSSPANQHARLIYVNTQFTFANKSDLHIFVRQRGHRVALSIPPHSKKPFSWAAGPRQIHVKVGDGDWTKAMNIYLASLNVLKVDIPEVQVSYELLMNVAVLDDRARVVSWSPRLKLRNDMKCDLIIRLGMHDAPLSAGTEMETAVYSSITLVSVRSNELEDHRNDNGSETSDDNENQPLLDTNETKHIHLSKRSPWSFAEIPVEIEQSYTTVLWRNSTERKSPDALPMDVTVRTDERGAVLVVLSENLEPPYILHNTTPYTLDVVQIRPLFGVSSRTAGYGPATPQKPIRHKSPQTRGTTMIINPEASTHEGPDGVLVRDSSKSGAWSEGEHCFVAPFSDQPYYLSPTEKFGVSGGMKSSLLRLRLLPDSAWNELFLADVEDESNEADTTLSPPHSLGWGISHEEAHRILGRAGSLRGRASKSKKDNEGGKAEVSNNESVEMNGIPSGAWSEPFTIEEIGTSLVSFEEDFGQYRDTRLWDSTAPLPTSSTRINMTISPRGKTKIATYSLADVSESGVNNSENISTDHTVSGSKSVGGLTLRVRARVLSLEVLLSSESKEDILCACFGGFDIAWCRGVSRQYLYATLARLQIDNLLNDAEFTVLLGLDDVRLRDVDANAVEILQEWSVESPQLKEFVGIRVLPIVVSMDGDLVLEFDKFLDVVKKHSENTGKQSAGVVYSDPTIVNKYRIDPTGPSTTTLIIPVSHDTRENVFIEKIIVFPLNIFLRIGDNRFGWPVSRDGLALVVDTFSRSYVHSPKGVVWTELGARYVRRGWREVYKIIGSMDVLGSPYGSFRKISRGLKDFVMIPTTSLVHDDTPGAFLVGVTRGSASLLSNTADAFLMYSFKLFSGLSWGTILLTFDPHYKLLKERSRRRHPQNALQGLTEGSIELLSSMGHAVSDIFTSPIKGARASGVGGFALNFTRSVIGAPMKCVGGVLDLFARGLEGLRNATIPEVAGLIRLREPQEDQSRFSSSFYIAAAALKSEGARMMWHGKVKSVTRRNRLRERLLLVNSNGISVINPEKIENSNSEESYIPSFYPFNMLSEIVAPTTPETKLYIVLRHVFKGKNRLTLLTPERKSLTEIISKLYGESEDRVLRVLGLD